MKHGMVNVMGTWKRDTFEAIWLNDWDDGPLREPRDFTGQLLANRTITGRLTGRPFQARVCSTLLQTLTLLVEVFL
jgi:hypothetical protein